MPETESLPNLQGRRVELLHSIHNLRDMRPGSIVGAVWRCGKPKAALKNNMYKT